MSIKLTNHLEGNYYQHKEFVLEQLPNANGIPNVQGILYTNTVDKGMYYHDGTNWKRIDNTSMSATDILTALTGMATQPLTNLNADQLDGQDGSHYLNRANHNGNVPVANITDLATTVQGYRLDQFAVPTADINLNNNHINNLANPTSDTSQEAAPANWVTTKISQAVQGLDVKGSVRAASTPTSGNVAYTRVGDVCTVTTPFGMLDGVNIASVGTRILLKNQTDAQQNAIYTVSAVSGSNVTELTVVRSDMQTVGGAVNQNVFVFVERGSTQADTGWVLSASQDAPLFLGTEITWHQFASAGVIEAGTGLSKSGNTLSVSFGDLGGGVSISRKTSFLIGNGAATEFTLTTFGSEDKIAVVREVSTGEQVLADVVHLNAVQTRIIFADPPSTNQYRVTVIG